MAFPPVPTPANAYTLTLSDGTTIAVVSGSYTTIGGLSLPGPNEVVQAVQLSDNFLHITECFASTTAPANPLIGQLWYDKNSPAQLKVWDGTAWRAASLSEDLVDPANTTIVPAPSSGTGILADPYIITDTAVSGDRILVASVTVSSLSPGSVISIVDLNGGANGGRFEFTNNVVDGAGNLVFDIYLNDNPASAGGTIYTANIKIGTSSAYIDITITMVASFPVTVPFPSGLVTTSTSWTAANDTLTPSGCIEISIDNSTWVSNPATLSVTTNDTLYTRWSGASGSGTCIDSADGTTINGGITSSAGGVTSGSLVIDKTPSAISFTALTGVALSTVVDSDTVTVGGFNSYAYITGTTTGTTLEASINGGAWTAVPAAGTTMYVASGDTLELRHTTGATVSTAYDATIDVGGLTGIVFSTTTSAAVPTVNTPSITTPTSGSTGISTTVTITGSAYSAVNGAGTHASTDWEIYSDSGLTTPVAAASSSADTVNLTSYTIPSGALSYSTQYWARIRYRDNTGTPVVSAYSTVVDFTTEVQPGVNWTYQSDLSATAWGAFGGAEISAIAWNGSQYVAVGGSSRVATSPDGITWTYQSGLSATAWGFTGVYDISWNGSQYVAVGGNGSAATSPDGITWTYQAGLSATAFSTAIPSNIIWNGSQYLVGGSFGRVATSPDGITWTYQAGLSATAWGTGRVDAIVWNGSQYVAGGASPGRIATSP